MSQVLEAVYEGNGLVRLEREPEGVRPHERLTVLVVPVLPGKGIKVEKPGFEGLRRQISAFEEHYSLNTPEFYARFLRGEMGDSRDYIVWAGLHELFQHFREFDTFPHHKHVGPDEKPEAAKQPSLSQVFAEVERILAEN